MELARTRNLDALFVATGHWYPDVIQKFIQIGQKWPVNEIKHVHCPILIHTRKPVATSRTPEILVQGKYMRIPQERSGFLDYGYCSQV